MWKEYNKSFIEFQKEFFPDLRGMEIEFLDDKKRNTKYLIGDICDNGAIGLDNYNGISKETIVLRYREWDVCRNEQATFELTYTRI